MNAIQKAIEVLQGCLDHPGADDAIAGLRAMLVQPAQCWKCGDADPKFQAVCTVPHCGAKEAQPAQPMPTCEDCGDGLTASNAGVCANCLPAYQAKREPLTAEQAKTLMVEAGYGLATPQEQADFLNGMRHAEIAHGITKETP